MSRTVIALAAVLAAGGIASAGAAAPEPAVATTVVYAAPDGTARACSRTNPCSIEAAWRRERQILASAGSADTVIPPSAAAASSRQAG
jgi:hypothetical protein